MQASHKAWVEENGSGPWYCSRCGAPVLVLGGHRHETSPDRGVVHHEDLNHSNNDPVNLRIMHDRCHVEHHEARSRDWPWREVADDLRTRVKLGLVAGQLPSRMNLAADYHVSHMTVQRAIDTLKAEGLLYSVRGLGVFVGRHS